MSLEGGVVVSLEGGTLACTAVRVTSLHPAEYSATLESEAAISVALVPSEDEVPWEDEPPLLQSMAHLVPAVTHALVLLTSSAAFVAH